mgnify:CR=1 FL=1
MEILLEILVGGLIILTIFLLFKLKTLHINAESLKAEAFLLREQLNHEHTSSQTRETNLHNTISGLQATISDERKSLKSKEESLKASETEFIKALADSEKTLQEEIESRKKLLTQKKSSEVRLGHIAETLAPFLDQFNFDPENCIFLGQPIDYVSFDDSVITFIEVKSGKSQLSSKQRHIRDLIKSKQVAWKEIRIN